MIPRQTTKANQQLIEEPLVTIVEPLVTDSDDDLVIMTEVFKLPTLDRKTKKDWEEKILSKIRKDELASYVSLRIWMEKIGKNEDQCSKESYL